MQEINSKDIKTRSELAREFMSRHAETIKLLNSFVVYCPRTDSGTILVPSYNLVGGKVEHTEEDVFRVDVASLEESAKEVKVKNAIFRVKILKETLGTQPHLVLDSAFKLALDEWGKAFGKYNVVRYGEFFCQPVVDDVGDYIFLDLRGLFVKD